MKKVGLIILLIGGIFNSCTEQQALVFTEKNITTQENAIVFINIPQVEGATPVAQKINRRLQQVVGASLTIDNTDAKVITSLENQINAFNQAYERFKADFPDTGILWEAQIDGEILYQSEEIVTVALTVYTNTGGAHGISTISLVNFHPDTGETLSAKDLFSDMGHFQSVAQLYFKKEIRNSESDYFDAASFVLPENIGYSNEGILLLYNVYEIAPYTSGITEVTVPFETIEDILIYH
ncbi:MAG TPA: DUF3298 and DUF4163 domain-containing protein [Flavobacteriaceae bacterium]|nr:DUF3298 and DUF4163 domain-containing protein [Flavobacteriaceae bacterium]